MRRNGFVILAALFSAAFPLSLGAQEELGKKERPKILIEWAKKETKNYIIEYEKVIPDETVKKIADALEEVLVQYNAVFKFTSKQKLKVKFLDSRNTYIQEGGDPSHPGFYSSRSRCLVIQQMEFWNLLPTVYHEAFHQYLHEYMGDDVPIPLWFNEGLATYYEGMQKDKQSKKLDPKLIDNRKLRMVRDAVFTRSAIPLEQLVDATPEQFHDKEKEDLYYNQSFAVVYFLMQAMGGKPVFQYATELKKTKDVAAATDKIFGKGRRNLKTIEKKWKEYVATVKIEEPESK